MGRDIIDRQSGTLTLVRDQKGFVLGGSEDKKIIQIPHVAAAVATEVCMADS